MGLYLERVYPRLIAVLGNPQPIREIRRQLIPQARGVVLEIGVGTGANLAHYDPTSVEKLYVLEPNPEMIRRAERPKPLTYCCWGVAERPLEKGDSACDHPGRSVLRWLTFAPFAIDGLI